MGRGHHRPFGPAGRTPSAIIAARVARAGL